MTFNLDQFVQNPTVLSAYSTEFREDPGWREAANTIALDARRGIVAEGTRGKTLFASCHNTIRRSDTLVELLDVRRRIGADLTDGSSFDREMMSGVWSRVTQCFVNRIERLGENEDFHGGRGDLCGVCVPDLNRLRIHHNYLGRYLHPDDRPDDNKNGPLVNAFNGTHKNLCATLRRMYFQVADGLRDDGEFCTELWLAVMAALHAQLKRRWAVLIQASNELLLRLPRRYEHPFRPTVDRISKRLAAIEDPEACYDHKDRREQEEARFQEFTGTTRLLPVLRGSYKRRKKEHLDAYHRARDAYYRAKAQQQAALKDQQTQSSPVPADGELSDLEKLGVAEAPEGYWD